MGCQTAPPPPPPTPAPVPVDQQWVNAKLDAAQAAFNAEHFTHPEHGSALGLLNEILARYPENEEASREVERLVEHYVEQALSASRHNQLATARSMLARARLILPDHPSIEPTTQQIRLLSEAKRIKLTLAQADLKNKDTNTLAQLADLGDTPSGQLCRFSIAALNDAQGRQLYRALSRGQPDTRLRAEIKIQLPASVERVCFD